jgi:GNAT superfamily N-acetyltransferase
MRDLILRPAVVEELPILLQFEQGVILAERPFDKTLKPEHITYYNIKQLIESTSSEVIVAVFKGEIIGSAYIDIKKAKPYLKHAKYGYLGFMYVNPDFRGKGINKLIINELKKWAKSRNIVELRLDVYDGNHPAIKAYEKVGFSKHLINMRLEVD